jgi:hypothetical protein
VVRVGSYHVTGFAPAFGMVDDRVDDAGKVAIVDADARDRKRARRRVDLCVSHERTDLALILYGAARESNPPTRGFAKPPIRYIAAASAVTVT